MSEQINSIGNTILNNLDKSGWLKTINDDITIFDHHIRDFNAWLGKHPGASNAGVAGGLATGAAAAVKGGASAVRAAANGVGIGGAVGAGIGGAAKVLAGATALLGAAGGAWDLWSDTKDRMKYANESIPRAFLETLLLPHWHKRRLTACRCRRTTIIPFPTLLTGCARKGCSLFDRGAKIVH
jgi:hypothetical protein